MLKDSLILNTEEAAQMKTIALLIQKASDFQSSIHIQCGERKANAKSLLGLMSLGLNNTQRALSASISSFFPARI